MAKRNPKGTVKKEAKPQLAHKNGKKAEVGGGTSFFTWFMVLALLGVWTSVAVVYFDLVDYQGVIAKAKDFRYNLSEVLQGKLVSYDADGDGDFDVEDAKVLLDENSKDVSRRKGELSHAKDVGLKLREALKQQLTIIHERVEARKIAKLALAEVRNILAKEEEERTLNRIREESEAKAWERAEARLKEEGERIEKEDVEKAMQRIRKEKEEREKLAESEEAKKTKVEKDEVKEKPEVEKKTHEKPVDYDVKKVEKDAKGKVSKKAAAKKKL
ncbi:hypothetical protein PO909_030876 [Leuciscus waleckii]